MNKRGVWGNIIVGFIIGIIVVGILSLVVIIKPENSCSGIKEVLKIEMAEQEIADSSNDVYDYYTLASNSYDISNYDMVIFYCEKSRTVSTKYSDELRELKLDYSESEIEAIKLREQMIQIEIDALFSLYQSCEYLESASRSYENENYAMGDANIDGQNREITRHDSLLDDYEELQVKYNRLRKEMLA